MEKDWVKVYASRSLQNVELLRHLLAEHSIDAVVINQQDSAYVVVGDIGLYVKYDKVILARKIISDSQL